MNLGRNDPCHCGSGKKYKKCHYAEDEERGRAKAAETRSPWHELDNRFVTDVISWAEGRYHEELNAAAARVQTLQNDEGLPLLLPWLAYHVPFDGRPAFERYADERGGSFSRRLRDWIDGQRRSWLGMWEVDGIVAGKSLTLRDLLTGEQRLVHEGGASRTARIRDVLLARVVDVGDDSLLGGTHPYPLPPTAAANVLDRLCDDLGLELPLPVERVRDYETSIGIIEAWEEALDDIFESAESGPSLVNADGDPVCEVIDAFTFAPEHQETIESILRAIADDHDRDDPQERVFTFLRDDDTVTGTVFLTNGELRAETNSVARADALRKLLEPIGPFTSITRSERSLEELLAEEAESDFAPPASPQTPELAAHLRALKVRHYERWLDDELPALDGSTPREAMATDAGRRKIRTMLKEIERIEAGMPEESRFDVAILRRALKIEE